MLTNSFIALLCLLCIPKPYRAQSIETRSYKVLNNFSTKTPYRYVANFNDQKIELPDCRPTKIWALFRHGTRNPSQKVIKAMKTTLVEIKKQILTNCAHRSCPPEFKDFQKWSAQADESKQKFLVAEGIDELQELGERYRNRFPSLFGSEFKPNSFNIKFTATQRAAQSAQNFMIGVFGPNALKIVYPEPVHNDPILRFYKLCNRWKIEVDKNSKSLKELELFIESPVVQATINAVAKQIGAQTLDWATVHLMYTTCSFETAWNTHRISPWCNLFTDDSIRLMEFAEDLEHYWIDGYGFEITYKQACPVAGDILDHLSADSIKSNVTLYFTHSGTALKLLAFFGLYKDRWPLTHADYDQPRKWRMSEINTFASNLAFITFECSSGPHVVAMHQERMLQIPGCPENTILCPFRIFEDILKEQIDNCSFERICDLK